MSLSNGEAAAPEQDNGVLENGAPSPQAQDAADDRQPEEQPQEPSPRVDEPEDSMSLKGKITGRVIMGMDTPGPDEMSVQDIEGKRKLVWDDSVDDEYMSRVRTKAQAMAKDILAEAMREAETTKEQARQQGYDEGIAQAQAELDQHVTQLSQSMEGVLAQVSAQGVDVWDARRQDIVTLIRMVTKKILHVEMEERRQEILASLLDQAVERIETERTITLRISPQDEELMSALLPAIQERNPAVKHWKLKVDTSIQQGGAIVETREGKVDNTLEARWAGVETILNELTILSPEEGGPKPQQPAEPKTDGD
ncbi:FliH/SctL family protein [Salidesulfovibrio onnuriiensis]|uniref:FliH/SctL family protein n=1 Tax=Salidesulfovibrio onnuriiensis TaxID=2583823 RepID=UPI0011CC05C5|nr:FliH/SctL family protein [Salidesulfovibrio onnuriiensis]